MDGWAYQTTPEFSVHKAPSFVFPYVRKPLHQSLYFFHPNPDDELIATPVRISSFEDVANLSQEGAYFVFTRRSATAI
jgi:hypothetical protein